MSLFINIAGTDYELGTTLRVGKALTTRYKTTVQELGSRIVNSPIDEVVGILKTALVDSTQAKTFEDAVLDGGCGNFELLGFASSLLLEITYPGDSTEKERIINSAQMTDEQKDNIREALGLPLKNPRNSERANSGSD